MMNISKTSCTLIVLYFSALSSLLAKSQSEEVQITKEFVPENCHDLLKTETGDHVTVHYTGYLENGQVFDSSVQRNRDPISFVLGVRSIIAGWNIGLLDMCKGEKRRLVIPSHLAYGDAGYPPAIPPKAILTFETHLLDLKKASYLEMIFYNLLEFAKVVTPPIIIAYVFYKMYSLYQQESKLRKEKARKEKKNAKNSRKRR